MDVLHDITQMSLAIITRSAFGMQIDAFDEEEEESEQKQQGEKRQKKKHGAAGGKYKMSFTRLVIPWLDIPLFLCSYIVTLMTLSSLPPPPLLIIIRCMEMVSQNTMPKIILPSWAFIFPFFNLREIGTAFKVR